MSALPKFLRAAKRKHAEPAAVFETAVADFLEPEQLARLASALREAHPEWRLAAGPRDALIDALADEWPATKIAENLGCSRTTVAKRAATRKAPPIDGLNKRPECPVSGGRVSFPILSFSAAGTAAEIHRRLLEMLGWAP